MKSDVVWWTREIGFDLGSLSQGDSVTLAVNDQLTEELQLKYIGLKSVASRAFDVILLLLCDILYG